MHTQVVRWWVVAFSSQIHMKKIAIQLCMAVVLGLAAMVAHAQTCNGTIAQLTSPPDGSTLPAGAVTFAWCDANSDYFLDIGTGIGRHDIEYAFITPTSITLGPVCQLFVPIECIPDLGEAIYVTLWTHIRPGKNWQAAPTVTYTAPSSTGAAAFSPPSLNTGSVLVGATSGVKTVTLSNIGTGDLTVSGVTASGNFSETDTCSGLTLAPSATCEISVTFTPTVTGMIPGALTVSDNALNSPQIVALSGNGLGSVSLAPSSLSFGTVAVGTTSTPGTVTLTNNTKGSLFYTFSSSANYIAVGSGTQPCTGTLAGKAKCTLSVAFSPTANDAANGSLAVSSASFPTQLGGLSGTGSGGGISPLTFLPPTLSVANTLVGTTSPRRTVTVTNASGSPLNITNFVASGDFAVVGSGTTPCFGTLNAGASCTVAVTFSPSVAGPIQGSITLMDNAPVNTQLYNLKGSAVRPVSFSPASLTFAAQAVGTTSVPKSVTLINNQAIALNLASLVASGQYTSAAGGTNPCGSIINAHSSCTFVVTFTPAQPGAVPGVVTVTHDASGNPQVVRLSGTGQ